MTKNVRVCIKKFTLYVKANTCPMSHRMNKALKFCYLAVEDRDNYDFTTGMAHSRNIGSRLAVLPTLDYHWYLYGGR